MSELELEEIHDDLEILKHDIAEIKAVLLNEEGELSEWAKKRISAYSASESKSAKTQEEVEAEFL